MTFKVVDTFIIIILSISIIFNTNILLIFFCNYMKFEMLILIITGGLVYDTYHEGKYTKMLTISKKYIKMVSYGFMGLSFYILFKQKPKEKQSVMGLVNDMIKFMPIDKNSSNMFFDLTSTMGQTSNNSNAPILNSNQLIPQKSRIETSGKNMNEGVPTKRSVSESKKKFVASRQKWKCNHCQSLLDATYEIDHIVELQYGGGNDVQNLVALCRNCHGNKTLQKFL